MQGTSERSTVGITVVFIGELRRLAGRRDVRVRLPGPTTVHTLARELGAVCDPAFAARVLTPDGDLQSHVAVFLNGEHLPTARDGAAYLTEGEVELMLLPMFEGG